MSQWVSNTFSLIRASLIKSISRDGKIGTTHHEFDEQPGIRDTVNVFSPWIYMESLYYYKGGGKSSETLF